MNGRSSIRSIRWVRSPRRLHCSSPNFIVSAFSRRKLFVDDKTYEDRKKA